MGLDVYLQDKYGNDVHKVSKTNPEHMFRVGYLRSSYNPSGFNTVLRNMIGMDLYDVFNVSRQGKIEIKYDWPRAREQALLMLKKFEEMRAAGTLYTVKTISFFGSEVNGPAEAIKVFQNEASLRSTDLRFGAYKNKNGEFYLDGQQFFGFIPGRDMFGGPTIYGICKMGDEATQWYHDAIKITIEFIEHAQTLEGATIMWSA